MRLIIILKTLDNGLYIKPVVFTFLLLWTFYIIKSIMRFRVTAAVYLICVIRTYHEWSLET